MGSIEERSLATLVSALVEVQRELADDLLHALTTYIDIETHWMSLDQAAGRNVSDRVGPLRRLTHLRDQLEGELDV
jgi:hypothetical protein